MRLFTSALGTAVAAALLAGCTGNAFSPNASPPSVSSVLPAASCPASSYSDLIPPRGVQVLQRILHPDKTKKPTSGIYVGEFCEGDVWGYAADNKANKGPICTISNVTDVNDVAVDGKGNLMIPDGGASYLLLYKGPTMCGKLLGEVSDTYGQPSDAASADSATGTIIIGNIKNDDGTEPGSVSICTLKAQGCSTNLTNSAINEGAGVALAANGDCWMSASGASSGGGEAALIYWKSCAGAGAVAKGFKNSSFGGLDIDSKGNLVSVDANASAIYIYSGCDPTCKVVAGPSKLHGMSVFGKLNSTSTEYVASDLANGTVDVYTYSTKGIKYEYSFSKGLNASELPIGVAVNPRSKQ
jgi:hypothetical protein